MRSIREHQKEAELNRIKKRIELYKLGFLYSPILPLWSRYMPSQIF